MKLLNSYHEEGAMKDSSSQFSRTMIPDNYDPIRHILLNFGALLIGTTTSILLAIWYGWPFNFLVSIGFFILMLLLGHIFVYLIHRFPLHKKIRGWGYPFKAHTIDHHGNFPDSHFELQSSRDLGGILFPPLVVLSFSILIIPLKALTVYFIFSHFINFSAAAGLAFYFAGLCYFYFLLYEIMHTLSHLPRHHPLLKFSPLLYMWKHHRLHHHPPLMARYNFGIVFPFMDWIFQTHYKNSQDL